MAAESAFTKTGCVWCQMLAEDCWCACGFHFEGIQQRSSGKVWSLPVIYAVEETPVEAALEDRPATRSHANKAGHIREVKLRAQKLDAQTESWPPMPTMGGGSVQDGSDLI